MSERETGVGWAGIIAARMPSGTKQRVQAGRLLRRTGAVAVRPGVYALPDSDEGRDSIARAAREVARQGGSALPCVVVWLDPKDDARLRSRFGRERHRKSERLLGHIAALERAVTSGSRLGASTRRTVNARIARLRKRLERESPAVAGVSAMPRERGTVPPSLENSYRGRTWVTRRGVLIDRIASAWLIVRFIDPEARFRFVDPTTPPVPGELRFDLTPGDFSHEEGRCTFETLARRFRSNDPALQRLAEMVHDLDLKDGKYGHAESPGVAQVIAGLAAAEPDDAARVAQGQWLFDCLYASLRPRPRLPKGALP